MSKFEFERGKMVPVPSHSIVPERDVDSAPVLEALHLGIDFGGLKAVDDFNLTIGKTEIAGLIGPNGAGKTTVFNLLTKVYAPTRGTILLNGNDTSGKTVHQVNRMGIARTFQNIRLFNTMTVEENVKVGLHNTKAYSTLSGILRACVLEARARGARACAGAAVDLRHAGPRRPSSRQPALRRSAPLGDRPCACDQPEPVVAR